MSEAEKKPMAEEEHASEPAATQEVASEAPTAQEQANEAAAVEESTPAGPVELVVWAEGNTQQTMTSDPEGQGRYALYLKQQFEAENPGVTVKIEYHGWDQELRQNLMNSLLKLDFYEDESYFD